MRAWLLWSKVLRRFSRWWALSPWERWVLVRLVVLLPQVWVGLRVAGFVRMRRWAENAKTTASRTTTTFPADPDEAYFHRCAELTAIAARYGFYQANCLHQSLALCRLLRRLGVPSHLCIGVKKGAGSLQAHAWVEVNDCVLGPTTEEFSRFESLGPMAANRETSS